MAYQRPVYIGPDFQTTGSNAALLMSRLDPNLASAAMLSALPRLGRSRADAIVAYREEFVSLHPGQIAFAKPEDLLNIKGIGPATVKNLTPYLLFDPPATRPSP
jgi:DNA uptake protein ComE-like DNA-binding protein